MMNLPNILTLSRIGFAGIMVYLLLWNSLTGNLWAAFVFFIASLTDFYDGYIAKKRGLISDFGKIMDPISDKVLILSIFVVLAYLGMLPWWMVSLIALREIVVTIDRLIVMRQGKVLAAEKAGKIKTVFQITTISVILLYLILDQSVFAHSWFYQIQKPYLGTINALMVITVALTLASGASYFKNKRNVLA
jgi:CDP-diacylglycerol---glycerol-3-phosphate 3-phosphatidyltransferase